MVRAAAAATTAWEAVVKVAAPQEGEAQAATMVASEAKAGVLVDVVAEAVEEAMEAEAAVMEETEGAAAAACT